MILGIVPARSGSKSIKDKNIRPLNGQPLISWTIKAGLACKAIDKLIVSTDNQKYADIAKSFGAEVLLRPAELAADDTPMIPVLQHALKANPQADTLVLLDPTSPLRQVSDINTCLEKLKLPDTDSVVTVCEAEHNPYYVMAGVKNDYLQYPLVKPATEIHRRQDAPKVYRLNACVYAIKRPILETGKIFTDKTRVVEMPQVRSSHIDHEVDYLYAEFLLKEGHVQLDF
ncbi:MAG TPA: acylneuraminate cytidylyltransferase family protein [Patescibacteria group bacterium]|nr:acylneuraminate cytidylyltransferase family protein [Patescibacteria group bacterium]